MFYLLSSKVINKKTFFEKIQKALRREMGTISTNKISNIIIN